MNEADKNSCPNKACVLMEKIDTQVDYIVYWKRRAELGEAREVTLTLG